MTGSVILLSRANQPRCLWNRIGSVLFVLAWSGCSKPRSCHVDPRPRLSFSALSAASLSNSPPIPSPNPVDNNFYPRNPLIPDKIPELHPLNPGTNHG